MINQRPKFLSVENPGCIFATFFVNNDLLGPWDPSYSISAEKMTYLHVNTIILAQNLWILEIFLGGGRKKLVLWGSPGVV